MNLSANFTFEELTRSEAAKALGKMGQRARLAQTLKGLKK